MDGLAVPPSNKESKKILHVAGGKQIDIVDFQIGEGVQ
jgi:hypothetical protein